MTETSSPGSGTAARARAQIQGIAEARSNSKSGLAAKLGDRWRAIRERHPGLNHVVSAYQHYKDNHGDHLAAAITYFSFLAIFPLIFLGVSVTGFILSSHPSLVTDINNAIDNNVPGDFGNTLKGTVNYAIAHRTSVGLIGVLGVAWTGLGWVANLRTAIDTVWGISAEKKKFVAAKAGDALVLFGLGLGVIVSLALTGVGTAATTVVLDWVGLAHNVATDVLTRVAGLLIAILGDMAVFGWLLIKLPDVRVSRRTAIRSTILAAVGFEVVKIVGAYYLAGISQSPATALLGAVVGILIFIDLISRYLLFCVAWAATDAPSSRTAIIADEIPVPFVPPERPPAAPVLSPIGLAAGLLSAGAAVGAGAFAWLQRRRS